MFPESRIASRFSCGEKKCAYLICVGLAPHFKQLLKHVVKKEEAYVLLFENDVDGLVKSTDEFAQKAEDTGKRACFTKSNSLRRTAEKGEDSQRPSLQNWECCG